MNCWACGYAELQQGGRVQQCPSCHQFLQIRDQQAYRVPSLFSEGEPRIGEWNGYGRNLLEIIQQSPLIGIPTRTFVVQRLLGIPYRNGARKERMVDQYQTELAKFGLELFFYETDHDSMTKSDFQSNPCIIKIAGEQPPEINLRETSFDGGTNYVAQALSPSADWVVALSKQMYPRQELSSEQEAAVRAIIEKTGEVVSAVIPTGGGKTRIAQLLAVSLRNGHGSIERKEGPILILSPTISLMDDQKTEWREHLNHALRRAGADELEIRVIHSNEDEEERDDLKSNLLDGLIDVVLCSPEQLVPASGKMSLMEIAMRLKSENVNGLPFSALVVDEAHIIYDWGDSIREAYLLLPQFKQQLRTINPNLRTLLLTATLSPREEKDLIEAKLGFSENQLTLIRRRELRRDLAFSLVEQKGATFESASSSLQQQFANHHLWRNSPHNSRSPLLIYTYSPSDADAMARHLTRTFGRSNIGIYSGQTQGSKRKEILEKFQRNRIQLLTATSAFGMGVNKPDVWLIGFVGMPSTVRELYQAFGRAARGSNWEFPEICDKKNGNCIAHIIRRRTTGYSPTMGISKAMERIMPMLLNGDSTSNGYALFSLNPDDQIFWNPYDRYDWVNSKDTLESVNLAERQGKMPLQIDQEIEERWQRRIQRRKQNEWKKRRKAAIMLEQAGFLRIVGFFPKNPVIVNSDKIPLKDLLEKGGLATVHDAYANIGWENQTTYNRSESNMLMVAEVLKPMNSVREIIQAIQEGIDAGKTWYDLNQQELRTFLNSKGCLRKRFSSVVGLQPEDVWSCEDEFYDAQSNALPEDEMPVVPCSECRKKIWRTSPPIQVPGSSFVFQQNGQHTLWLREMDLEYLSGRLNSVETSMDDSYQDINRIPVAEFRVGFPTNREQLSHGTARHDVWFGLMENYGVNAGSGIYEIPIHERYDKSGELIGGDDVGKIRLHTIHGATIREIDVNQIVDESRFPFGGLLFESEHGLVCREVDDGDAIRAFRRLIDADPDRKDEIIDLFIGQLAPDINGVGEQRSWSNF